jgi:DeoR/GlpR family transcriptional regulator of sugar metabolism
MLAISEVTIRRDLGILQADGRINRRHGGAFAARVQNIEISRAIGDTTKVSRLDGAHQRIAARATTLLDQGNVILLSAGPISEEIARHLQNMAGVTVITNSVAVFDLLRKNINIHLIATGGELRRSEGTLIGPLAEASVREIRVDKLFLEPSGISGNYQLFHSSLPDIPMQQSMIQAAREIIVVADHESFGQEGIMQIASINIANKLITDDQTPEQIWRHIEAEGVEIVFA